MTPLAFPRSLHKYARIATATALLSLLATGGSAQGASFPQYPLLTGGTSIAPNILLILDDSGSMAYQTMPTETNGHTGSPYDNPTDRSYINNTLIYNPANTYLPWRTSSENLNDRLPNADFTKAYDSDTIYNGGTARDLRTYTINAGGTVPVSYFYVPTAATAATCSRDAATNAKNAVCTNAANYDKYRITTSTSANSFNGGVVQKQTPPVTTQIATGTTSALKNSYSTDCPAINTNGATSVTVTLTNSGNSNYLYVYGAATGCNSTPSGTLLGSDTSNNATKTITINSPPGTIYIRTRANSNSATATATTTWTVTGTSSPWQDATPTGRSQADELQNYANWYQYHRTRNKMAKAGVSEAFGRLGENYRVGYDTIWNLGGVSNGNPTGSSPSYPIPVGTNNGQFAGVNRDTFYTRLQNTAASNNTPLQGALDRAGRYFKTDDPYKDSAGQMLTCRQNYAILTTDGYWNASNGYTLNIGNYDTRANGATYYDNYSNTLGDIAYYYWHNDLKPTMADNVPVTGADPANWQHMVTFSVSIGQQGSLDPTQPPPNPPWPSQPSNSGTLANIDDLWHAALNGHGSFVVASDTDKFAAALTAALAAIDARRASGSNLVSSSTKTDTTTLTFTASFTSGSWLGDLSAAPFNNTLSGISTTPIWQMSDNTASGVLGTFSSAGVNNSNYFPTRTILTSYGGTAKLFTAGTMAAETVFARTTGTDAVNIADNINYLRGDQSKETGKPSGTLRQRTYPMGDIADSSPAYSADTNTVYIGANDGMLHGLDAGNGKVLFSYVPKGLDFASLSTLSMVQYEHHYFVDGSVGVISQADQGSGKNILVGVLGRGGRGAFALDVTTPTAMGTSNVLWDQTTQDTTTDPNMGYVLGTVRIRPSNNGTTYALVPNGIDSPNGSAVLYVYELDGSGHISHTYQLVADAGSTASPNGLISLGLADLNGDGKVDTVYGGDLKGNIWRWDFTSPVSGSTPAVKLFQAKDASGNPQPITGGIAAGRQNGKIFIGFGTGRYISNSDVPGGAGYIAQTQSLYGIIDTNTPVARSDLQQRTIPYSGTTADGLPARGFETYSDLSSSKKGWYIDLPQPERVTTGPTIYGTAMYITSIVPGTGAADCGGGTGGGFINAIDLFTGTNPPNGGYFADTTQLTYTGSDSSVKKSASMGSVAVTTGMPTQINVTSTLACVTGQCRAITPPNGGTPNRTNWREVK